MPVDNSQHDAHTRFAYTVIPISFAAFDPRVSRADFDCGNDEINEWFRTQAGQQHRRDTARTTVGWDAVESRIASFYTLVAHQLRTESGAIARGGTAPRYPLPAILIAQLGVDSRYQGRGIGSATLAHALNLLADTSQVLGFQYVVVDAIDEAARQFYERHGFRPTLSDPRRLVMRTSELRARTVRM